METETETQWKGVAEGERVERREKVRFQDLLLRLTAGVLTFTAAVVLGVNKQTERVTVQLTPALPPLHIPVTAKWHYLSAFVYLEVANGIACSYGAFSLLLSTIRKQKHPSKRWKAVMMVMDIVMVGLLFSGFGAAAAVGLIGLRGNSHVRWNQICNVFGRFCGQGAAALLLSLAGAVAFLSLAVSTALNLLRKSQGF